MIDGNKKKPNPMPAISGRERSFRAMPFVLSLPDMSQTPVKAMPKPAKRYPGGMPSVSILKITGITAVATAATGATISIFQLKDHDTRREGRNSRILLQLLPRKYWIYRVIARLTAERML